MTDKAVATFEQSARAVLHLSEAAKAHLLKSLNAKEGCIGVRLSLSKTGCSGLSYVFDYVQQENPEDKKVTIGELTLYIERKSYPYLKGLSIDFKREGLNQKFIYDNPNQTGQCGCGESFTVS